MVKKDEIITLIDFLNALNNENRKKILEITYKNPTSITQISREIKISQKVTWEHVRILKKLDLVRLDKREREKSRPVYVESKVKPEWYSNLIKNATKDIKNSLESIKLLKENKKIIKDVVKA